MSKLTKLTNVDWEGLKLAESFAELRSCLGYTQSEVARAIGMTASAVTYIELGSTKTISQRVIDGIVNQLLPKEKDEIVNFFINYNGNNKLLKLIKMEVELTVVDPYSYSNMTDGAFLRFILKAENIPRKQFSTNASIGINTATKALKDELIGESSVDRIIRYVAGLNIMSYYRDDVTILNRAIRYFKEGTYIYKTLLKISHDRVIRETKEEETIKKTIEEEETTKEIEEFIEPEEELSKPIRSDCVVEPSVPTQSLAVNVLDVKKEEIIDTIIENYDFIKEQLEQLAKYSKTLRKIDSVVSTFQSIMNKE